MTIQILRQEDEKDIHLAIVKNIIDKYNVNYSEELLGEYKTDDNIEQTFKEMVDDKKIRISYERLDELNSLTEDEVKTYIDELKTKARGYENNFTHIIKENDDIFAKFLLEQNSYTKTNCKELLVESIAIYKTKYNDELYIKTDDRHFKHIGNSYEDIYQYYKKLYQDTQNDLQRYIPFSSFFTPTRIKTRTFESLEPNRHIILFDDCILNVENGKTSPYDTITRDIIPFSVINGIYKERNKTCYQFVTELLNKLVENSDILKSVLYSIVNKDELVKSAIFNIQDSGKGKTMLLDPFKQLGILITAKSKMLEKYLEIENLFRQRLIVNFEEIQDAQIQGSDFNSFIDDSAITVSRKNKTAIDIPAYIKPAIIINGEDLPDFKGRTRGTLNRFSLMPIFVDEITEQDAEFIKANGFQIGIEMLRYLMLFKMNTTKKQRREWLETCKITEKQYIELRESKTKTIFKYIDEVPQVNVTPYCISEKILEDIIIYLQDMNILTVNLFNKESSIKKFIKQEIINGLDLQDGFNDGYMNQVKRKRVHKHGTDKTHAIKYCLQLTEKGKEIVSEIGYEIQDLQIFSD